LIMKKKFECMFGFIAIAALFVAGCEKENLASEVNVSGQSVEAAHPGDQVSVAGDNFNTVRFVSVGDKQASFELDDDTINFVVPEDAEVGNNKIVLSMEDNSKVQLSFRVLPWLLPRIQEFDAFVPVGGELVITGRKFNPENDP